MMWSDALEESPKAGSRVQIVHSELNLRKYNGSVPDALLFSSAIRGSNVKILHAESVGVHMYKCEAWLGRITKRYNLIVVSGSHGNLTSFVFCGRRKLDQVIHVGKFGFILKEI
ncbi:hypothetical protein FXO38_02273 [Capsicum annuum]|uniref:Uncharacterized protein n=1 Tax=Capsicum annuum TaxID=4072 RepID=A0A2G2ZZG4_CAPAN|nr:hypothetical protein FXO38_02273 [Capsicum annuum]PHT87365.1 hypothetical protein T459_09471 [Capsicum annuum]